MNGRAVENEIRYYSEIEEKAIEWLWYPYIPYGKITVLQGDPGDGKSTFMQHIVSIVTKGGELPGGQNFSAFHNVIYQCSEDNTSDTIKPRLISAGADCTKVAFIDEENQPLTINDQRIEQALQETNAKLLVLDPIQAYLPSDGDVLNPVRMRSIMRNLTIMADRYHCAVVLIGHMTKAAGGKKLYRGLGSIDLAAIARSVLMITRDTNNQDIRYLFPVKTNLAYEGKPVSFSMSKESGFQMIGQVDLPIQTETVETEEHDLNKSQKAEKLLKELLLSEDLPTKKILKEMKKAGIGERTARTAAKNIGVNAVRKDNLWFWTLEAGS
ncbi:MAG: AAA family ATPase [Oscillospiraceae bacterium]|nr:AAA family ATPase [Oscillospiraceae bacterium]